MFTADLGELFSNVGSGSLSHSTNTNTTAVTTTHTVNNVENIRNPASLTPSMISGSSPAKPSTLVLSGVSKTSFLSSSTTALEDLFSSEYEISAKASHMNSTSHSLGPNTKAQPQTTRLPIASNDGAPIAESVANVVTSKQPTLTTAPNRGALRCPVCDKAFSNSSAIAKHKLTHSEERKYVCGICHKAFKRQDHLNGHKYTHESKKPHACHFCDKSYSDARSLRRHYENAHPEEYSRWLVLSQATNGDTSAIAVAAAAALFSSGLDKDSTDKAAKELHVGPSTSAVLSSVLNGPVRGVLNSTLVRSATGWSASCDALKAARSESASPASSVAVNEHHGCSPATSPTGQIDASEKMDDDESHDARPVMTLTAEDMAAAAKVALIMAHPLEAPKRVACAVCQKRFKNQSALNGHMRLHGGYGPAGIGVSNITHTSSTTTSTQSKTSKSHPSDDCHYSVSMNFDEKSLAQGKTDPIGSIRLQRGQPNLTNPTFQLSDHSHSPNTARMDESSQTLFDFISMRPNRDDSVWRAEAHPVPPPLQSDLSNFQHERNSSQPSTNESLAGGNNTSWLSYSSGLSSHSSGHPTNAGSVVSNGSDLRRHEARSTDSEVNLSVPESAKSVKQTSYSNLSHHIPRSASATAVSSMVNCCSRPRPVGTENSWSAGVNTSEDWQKSEHSRSNPLHLNSETGSSFDKNSFEPPCAITWWSESQQQREEQHQHQHQCVSENDRRSENLSWSSLVLKADPPVVNMLTQASGNKMPQFLDLDTKALSSRSWQATDHRGLFDAKSVPQPPPPQPPTSSSRRRCNAPLNLDLSALSQPDRPSHVGSHLGLIPDAHLSAINRASGQVTSTSRDDSFRPHISGFSVGQHIAAHPSCGIPPGLGNQYSPVTPAPGSASLVLDQKVDQPMAFTFPPVEQFQSANNNGSTATSPLPYLVDPNVLPGKAALYCTSPSARLPSVQENTILPSKVLNTGDRTALRHSASSDKLTPFLTRWHSGPADSSRSVPIHDSGIIYGSPGLGQDQHQQEQQQQQQRRRQSHQQQQQQTPLHLYQQERFHFPQLSSGCSVFPHPGHNVLRMNESWSDQNSLSGARAAETSSTASVGQGDVLSSLMSTNIACANHGDPQVHCPNQRCMANHTTITKVLTEEVELSQTFSPDFHPIAPAHRHTFTSETKPLTRSRPYQSIGETPSFGDMQPHSLSTIVRSPSNRSSHTVIEEPERTRHTSAPFLFPACHPDAALDQGLFPCSEARNNASSHGYSSMSQNSMFLHAADPVPHSPITTSVTERMADADMSQLASTKRTSTDFTSDTVADLLMQSHITDPFTIPEKLGRCNAISMPRSTISFTSTSSLTDVHRSHASVPPRTNCVVHGVDTSGALPHSRSPSPSEPFTGITLPPALPPTTKPLASDIANGTAGSSSTDESDQSAVTRLSKSLVEDTLFRNPHTLPPPKKLKRKPAPIFIPPQAGANLSRLRSPRIWGSDGSALSTSPLPYTPPPMLSPNRRGSGLFSSLTRWPSTASPVVANRRYSSYYPFASSSSVQSNGDMIKRKSTNLSTVPFGSNDADGGQMLKRSYTGRLMEPGNTEMNNAFSLSVSTVGMSSGVGFAPLVHGPRQFALPKRRCQLTPKSAPVLLQEASNSMLQSSVQNTDATEPMSQELPPVSNSTVFGYDDETMRRIAEADAADRARRLRRQRRRCDTEHLILEPDATPHATISVQCEAQPQVLADPNLMQVDEKVGDLMDYKPHEELEIVEDTLAVLDEEMQDQAIYDDEDDNEDDGEDEDEEEGLPSSLIPRINIGEAFQADIPEFSPDTACYSSTETEKREILMWNPCFIDEDDVKNIESLNLLMKLSCSPAIRNCGLNIEYAFHLLCKYEGNVEKALHALLRDTLVVDDYVYAETALWTTEEITQFQCGLARYGRDFHLVARALQSSGMNKTVKACVEFYYVWKRMNTPADVKWYREKARRLRLSSRNDASAGDNPLPSFELADSVKESEHSMPAKPTDSNHLTTASTYNLRRKIHSGVPGHSERSTVLPTVPEQTVDSQRVHFDEISTLDTSCAFDFVSCPSADVDSETVGLDGVVDDLVCSLTVDPLTESGSYPCRFCSRVFTKVKSRNAHMKSHNDRVAGPPGSSTVNRPLPQTTC